METWDRRAHLSSRVSDVIVAVAQYHFHVDIDTETQQRWSELMQLMREIDTKADEPGSKKMILSELEHFRQFDRRYQHIAPGNFPDDRQAQIGNRVFSILTDGERLTSSTSDYRYIAARRHEAVEVARLFGDTASDFVRTQENFFDDFIPFLEQLTIAANYFDSARDLPEDKRDNIVTIEPTAKLRAHLLKRTADIIAAEYPAMLHKEIILPYAKLCLIGYYSHHLKNKKKRQEKRHTTVLG